MRNFIFFLGKGLGHGVLIACGFFITTIAAVELSGTFRVFESGTVISAADINANFSALKTGVEQSAHHDLVPPVGSIIPWHKSFTGTPALPDGWLECNGQTVSDSASVYNGLAVPDLNNPRADPAGGAASTYTGGSFLRGSNTSGAFQADSVQGHVHGTRSDHTTPRFSIAFPLNYGGYDWTFTPNNSYPTGSPHTDGSNGTPRTDKETRPINMSVVWIIRIK